VAGLLKDPATHFVTEGSATTLQRVTRDPEAYDPQSAAAIRYAGWQSVLAKVGRADNQCFSCRVYRSDGQPPILHHPWCSVKIAIEEAGGWIPQNLMLVWGEDGKVYPASTQRCD
jgi:hypothetical protein